MNVKNNKGVSIITLVLTIIVMLIITSFAVYYSSNITPEARLASAYTSLKEVRRACLEAKSTLVLKPEVYDEYYFFGKNIFLDSEKLDERTGQKDITTVNDLAIKCGLTSEDDFGKSGDKMKKSVYIITPLGNNEEDKRRIKQLEISNVDRVYVCDLDKNNYYVLNGVKRQNGEICYEFKQIEALYNVLTEAN